MPLATTIVIGISMKIRELIEALQKEDPETIIYTQGPLGGHWPLDITYVGWNPGVPRRYYFPAQEKRRSVEYQGPLERFFIVHIEG